MVMEEHGARKCFPVGWRMAAKRCDSCKSAAALLFCRVDSAFLCMACDESIHKLDNSRHERVWMCEVCEQASASVTCKADAAALCISCDRDIHSANLLARRHERLPVVPFYDTAESFVKSASTAATFLVPAVDDKSSHTCFADAETTPPSWILPNPTTKLSDDTPDMKSTDFLFSDSDQFLDFDYPISIHNSGTDRLVPVQPMKSLPPATQQKLNRSSENYLEIDFTSSNLNSCNNSSTYTAQSRSQSITSSSIDVGVVPDGSSMSDISYPFGFASNNSVDLGSSVNTMPCPATDRQARVLRYREKRKNRKFEKMIRYASRKAYAETRPRIKGRFAKRVAAETEVVDRMFTSGSSAFMAEAAGYGIVPT